MKKTITIDGFQFEGRYSDVTDVENLNYFLEKEFGRFEIKEFMSRRHPELFPRHIGLRSDQELNLEIVFWERCQLGPEGEYDNSWNSSKVPSPERFADDILEFYRENNRQFYNFIADKI